MTTEIERPEEFNVWFRQAGSEDPWTQLIATYAKMLPGQEWELSQDGVKAAGTLRSREVGKGGVWSGFISPIQAGEVRKLGTSPVFVHGS